MHHCRPRRECTALYAFSWLITDTVSTQSLMRPWLKDFYEKHVDMHPDVSFPCPLWTAANIGNAKGLYIWSVP